MKCVVTIPVAKKRKLSQAPSISVAGLFPALCGTTKRFRRTPLGGSDDNAPVSSTSKETLSHPPSANSPPLDPAPDDVTATQVVHLCRNEFVKISGVFYDRETVSGSRSVGSLL